MGKMLKAEFGFRRWRAKTDNTLRLDDVAVSAWDSSYYGEQLGWPYDQLDRGFTVAWE